MRELSRFRFNVLYTPGTVSLLQLFVFSWLRWLHCSFRLVANGCSADEVHILQTLCHRHPRLEFLAIPTRQMMPHDQALSYLHTLEDAEFFCFMDSDILATGDFVSELTPCLSSYAGVFSGSPVFCQEDERILPMDFPKMLGRFNRTNRGVCLGSTYLALYDNRVLTRVMTSTGVSFERYLWADVPAQYQHWLAEKGLRKESYDTGKLLNLLLLAQKGHLIFQDSPHLLHISGITKQMLREMAKQARDIQNKKTLVGQARRMFDQLRTPSVSSKSKKPRVVITDAKVAARIESVKMKRRTASRYFVGLLRSLYDDRPLPAVPTMDSPEVEKKMRGIASHIVALYEEFKEQLVH